MTGPETKSQSLTVCAAQAPHQFNKLLFYYVLGTILSATNAYEENPGLTELSNTKDKHLHTNNIGIK